jgi:transcriptional regulator with XRE-family HTH domain
MTTHAETGGPVRRRPGRSVPADPAKIRAQRERRAWPVAKLAEATGLSTSLINAIETGASGCSARSLDRIATAFGIDPARLLKGRSR